MTYQKALAGALTASFLATNAFALTDIQSVEVSVDLDAVQNERAAIYWANLASDIQNGILAQVADRMDNPGTQVSIDIDEVSLANTFENTLGLEESFLKGAVVVDDYPDAGGNSNYDLTVSYAQAAAFFPENVDLSTITTDSDIYYLGMVNAFVDNVVAKLP